MRHTQTELSTEYVGDKFDEHIASYPHGGGGASVSWEGNNLSFCVTVGDLLIQGGTIDINSSSKEYDKKQFIFLKNFGATPVVCATFNTSRSKNIGGCSSVYVEEISTSSVYVIYDSASQQVSGKAQIIAVGKK